MTIDTTIFQTPTVIRLDDYRFIEVSGTQAQAFLQGQLSCDMNAVSESAVTLAVHCDHKGRIVSLLQVVAREQRFLLQVPAPCLPMTLQQLEKYQKFYKTVSLLADNPWRSVGVIGVLPENISPQGAQVAQHPGVVQRTQLIADNNMLPIITRDLLTAYKFGEFSAWELIDIASGIPHIYPDTSGELLPHYLNLDQLSVLSFTKGCYTGQEIIARMHYLGKREQRKQRTIYLVCQAKQDLQRKYLITDAQKNTMGFIIDYCLYDGYHHILAQCLTHAINIPLWLGDVPLTRRPLPYEQEV